MAETPEFKILRERVEKVEIIISALNDENEKLRAVLETTVKAAPNTPPESGFSLNLSFTGKTITQGQVTFRTPNAEEWRLAFDQFAAMIKERGWEFAAKAEKPPERVTEQATPANGYTPPPVANTANALPVAANALPVAVTPQAQQTTAIFPAATMTATVTDGKTYWKVKGGRFGKWGVTIWTETLDASGFAHLDPLKSYDLSADGWKAEYVEKDGKPDKVIRLFR